MAVMSAAQRLACRDAIINAISAMTGVTKPDLLAAVNGADAWVDNNTTSYNTAIPQPARNALTTSQKALLLELVVDARFRAGV
jgi:hypothetical protein